MFNFSKFVYIDFGAEALMLKEQFFVLMKQTGQIFYLKFSEALTHK
jgi:hypothetical protein